MGSHESTRFLDLPEVERRLCTKDGYNEVGIDQIRCLTRGMRSGYILENMITVFVSVRAFASNDCTLEPALLLPCSISLFTNLLFFALHLLLSMFTDFSDSSHSMASRSLLFSSASFMTSFESLQNLHKFPQFVFATH